MSEGWDDYADEWDSNSDVIEYSKLAFDSLCTFQSLNDIKVLDFGCGTGLLTEKISPLASYVLAVDSSPKMIEILKTKNLPHVETLACEISQESIIENPDLQYGFDLIVASSVCAFVPDYKKTLTDLKSLLSPGGIFIQWDWKRSNEKEDFGFTSELIKSAYINAGFSPLRVSTEFSLKSEKGTMEVIMGIAKNA